MDLGEKNNPITELRKAEVKLKNGDAIYLDIPKTVYPPREDSALLIEYLETLKPNGIAMEIGCGSGILSIILARNNWIVESCDVNPFAIAAAKKNSISASVEEKINFVVQINGKKRAILNVNRDISENSILDKIKSNIKTEKFLQNKKIKKIIFVSNRLINIII